MGKERVVGLVRKLLFINRAHEPMSPEFKQAWNKDINESRVKVVQDAEREEGISVTQAEALQYIEDFNQSGTIKEDEKRTRTLNFSTKDNV